MPLWDPFMHRPGYYNPFRLWFQGGNPCKKSKHKKIYRIVMPVRRERHGIGDHERPGPMLRSRLMAHHFAPKKTWGAEAPHAPRFSRNASDCDLHEKAGGMPLPTITAPSVHLPRSASGRSANKPGSLTSQYKNVGPKRTRYAPSRKKKQMMIFFRSPLLPLLPRKESPS